MVRLYRPDKFPVVVGKGKGGLCSCWYDPKLYVEKHKEVLDNYFIVGSLYSEKGVAVMIRNLALNPHVRFVVVDNSSKLSQTEVGRRGWEFLFSLFRKEGGALDRLYSIDKALLYDKEVVEKILSNVSVVLKGGKVAVSSTPYMEPFHFSEVDDNYKVLPSEKGVVAVRRKSLVDAWLDVLSLVYRYGVLKKGNFSYREFQNILWSFSEIGDLKRVLDLGLEKEKLESYFEFFLDKTLLDGVSYTYGNRIMSYFSVDQLDKVLEELKKDVMTRRAYISLYDPKSDLELDSPPCLTAIQFLYDGDGMNVVGIFRSHDIYKAAFFNAYALYKLLDLVSSYVGLNRGKVVIHSISAHIYEDDEEFVGRTLSCLWKPKLIFDEEEYDERGNVKIWLEDGKIKVEIEGIEFEGYSASYLAKVIASGKWLSKESHYVYLGMELQKAEYALKNGFHYEQDKPIAVKVKKSVKGGK